MRGLKDKVVIVTGGSSGIGGAVAQSFAECSAGHHPWTAFHLKGRDERPSEHRRICGGRRSYPEEVARWIVALADLASEWFAGQVKPVDGGLGLA